MNKEEIILMLSILKKAYPNFYKNITKQEAEDTINLYEEMFKDCDGKLVLYTVKELINTFEYPPTIATIKKKMYELTHIEDESPSDLWEILLKAIGRSGYYAVDEFEKLPDIIKEFIKSPHQLHELSQIPSETLHSVIRGQFLRQIENLKERVKAKEMMSPEVRQFLLNGETKLLENQN